MLIAMRRRANRFAGASVIATVALFIAGNAFRGATSTRLISPGNLKVVDGWWIRLSPLYALAFVFVGALMFFGFVIGVIGGASFGALSCCGVFSAMKVVYVDPSRYDVPKPCTELIYPYQRFLTSNIVIPMTWQQKGYLALHDLADPVNFGTILGISAIFILRGVRRRGKEVF